MNMNKRIKFFLTVAVMAGVECGSAQIHKVFISNYRRDSVYASLKYDSVFGTLSQVEFAKKLAPGIWVAYGIGLSEKDSAKKFADDHIEGIGYFNKDSLRNGSFYYDYVWLPKKGSNNSVFPAKYSSRLAGIYNGAIGTRYPTTVLHYKNGKLDGSQVSRYSNGSVREIINYVDGKRNGLTIVQDQPGFAPGRIETYAGDTLVSWSIYYANGTVNSRGQGGYDKLNGNCEVFDTLGNIYYSATFEYGSLKGYRLYSKGEKCIEEATGSFDFKNMGSDHLNICKSMPVNGTVKYFGEDNMLKKEETYKGGKLIQK